ncbi:MAG: cytochrome c [Gallionellaceae bacterium]|nr:MAG: cytochrome c [Gallionellaceae bacterium]
MKRVGMLLLLVSTAVQAAPFANGNAEAGKKFFEQNQCNRCHIQMVGGDGSEIFTRPDHKVRSASQLIKQINFCSGNAGIHLSAQDEQNLGAYLNQRYYQLK